MRHFFTQFEGTQRLFLLLLLITFGVIAIVGVAITRTLFTPRAAMVIDQSVVLIVPTRAPTPTSHPSPLAPDRTLALSSLTASPTREATLAVPTVTGSGDIIRTVIRSTVRVQAGSGTGTGFVAGQRGGEAIIVTNAHVIGNARSLSVILPDGSQRPVKVLDRDNAIDLALLAVPDVTNLPSLNLANPATLNLGDPLYIVGFALGSELLGDPSVSRGVVSGQRLIGKIDYIQTDAAMNPGNSGGPVINSAGEVVGIATWGIRDVNGQEIQGINFAIPSNLIRDFLKRT